MVSAICHEITTTGDFIPASTPIHTIYFGGGTPSLLLPEELKTIFKALERFSVSSDAEITLEANPDDIQPALLEQWQMLGINRLSIGIQSFWDEELKWMNRAHSASHAEDCLRMARAAGFTNYSADLIFGSPLQTNQHLQHNLNRMLYHEVPHLSCYALTIEPKTALHLQIKKRLTPNVSSDKQAEQFYMVMDTLTGAGYEHYEISNYALPGMRSKHNSSYWMGMPYFGFGPAAHSFNGSNLRRWNISNNGLYIAHIQNETPHFEGETLSERDQWNEWIMTGLRTSEGLNIEEGIKQFGADKIEMLKRQSEQFIQQKTCELVNGNLLLTRSGKILADGIAAELFH